MYSPTLNVTFDSIIGLSAIARLQELKIHADFNICSFIENSIGLKLILWSPLVGTK